MKAITWIMFLIVLSLFWFIVFPDRINASGIPCIVEVNRVEKLSPNRQDTGIGYVLDNTVEIPIDEVKHEPVYETLNPKGFKTGFYNAQVISDDFPATKFIVDYYGHSDPLQSVIFDVNKKGYKLSNGEYFYNGDNIKTFYSSIMKGFERIGSVQIIHFKDKNCKDWYILSYEIYREIGSI